MTAVIYDLDDLMVESHTQHRSAWAIVLDQHGHPEEVDISMYTGMRVMEIAEDIARRLNLPDPELLFLQQQEIFRSLIAEHVDALPGLRASLELCSIYGYRMAIASSGTLQYIKIVLKKLDIAQYFELIVSGDDVAKGKPDPEVYLKACSLLQLDPAQCVVLEDATKGIAAAKAAGCRCIGVRNPFMTQDMSQADIVVDSLADITLDMLR